MSSSSPSKALPVGSNNPLSPSNPSLSSSSPRYNNHTTSNVNSSPPTTNPNNSRSTSPKSDVTTSGQSNRSYNQLESSDSVPINTSNTATTTSNTNSISGKRSILDFASLEENTESNNSDRRYATYAGAQSMGSAGLIDGRNRPSRSLPPPRAPFLTARQPTVGHLSMPPIALPSPTPHDTPSSKTSSSLLSGHHFPQHFYSDTDDNDPQTLPPNPHHSTSGSSYADAPNAGDMYPHSLPAYMDRGAIDWYAVKSRQSQLVRGPGQDEGEATNIMGIPVAANSAVTRSGTYPLSGKVKREQSEGNLGHLMAGFETRLSSGKSSEDDSPSMDDAEEGGDVNLEYSQLHQEQQMRQQMRRMEGGSSYTSNGFRGTRERLMSGDSSDGMLSENAHGSYRRGSNSGLSTSLTAFNILEQSNLGLGLELDDEARSGAAGSLINTREAFEKANVDCGVENRSSINGTGSFGSYHSNSGMVRKISGEREEGLKSNYANNNDPFNASGIGASLMESEGAGVGAGIGAGVGEGAGGIGESKGGLMESPPRETNPDTFEAFALDLDD